MKTPWLIFKFLLLLVVITSITLKAKGKRFQYHNALHQQKLIEISNKAEDKVNNNLNRFGLAGLQYYDQLSDSLFKIECADTITSINSTFAKKSVLKIASINKSKSEIKQYSSELSIASNAFYSLLRKSLLALALWLGLAVFIIRYRKRKADQAAKNLSVTKKLSEISDTLKAAALITRDEKIILKKKIEFTASKALTLKKSFSAFNESDVSAEKLIPQIKELISIQNRLTQMIQGEINSIESLIGQTNSSEKEKSMCSINDLCEYFLELSYRGNCLNPDQPFGCQVTKDLEKNLPLLSLFPEATGELLLNVFDNAFKAVRARAAKGEKGYEPKVSVSTRILPKFIQIRVKDNGIGIEENIKKELINNSQSYRSLSKNAGTGLAIAAKILREKNKGELRIESESGNGTDLYIKLFT